MNMLAILGFVTIGVFLALVTLTRTPVIVALVLVPLATAVAGGFSGQVGAFAIDGLRTVAPVAALIMFAVLYFGLMIDVGLFTPLIERLLGFVHGDPVRLCLATAALAMLVALDGDGATTFLISITALLPVHRRLGMTPLVLPAIVALSAGVMNLLPWGGPTARAMSVLRAGVDQVFIPVLPAMGVGIVWVFFVAWRLGRSERRRLAAGPPFDTRDAVRGRRDATPGVTGTLLFQRGSHDPGDRSAAAGSVPRLGRPARITRPAHLHGGLCHRLAGQPENRHGRTRSNGLSRGERRPRGVDDPCRGRLHRHPEWQRDDQGDGHRARVEYPVGCCRRGSARSSRSRACRSVWCSRPMRSISGCFRYSPTWRRPSAGIR